jgi:hypothetical protein
MVEGKSPEVEFDFSSLGCPPIDFLRFEYPKFFKGEGIHGFLQTMIKPLRFRG